MIDLEHALIDLGDHLDVPVGDDLVASVTSRLSDPALDPHAGSRAAARPTWRPTSWSRSGSGPGSSAAPGGQRRQAVVVAVAVVVAICVAITAITPAREAVASWLGIGAVEVRNEPTETSSVSAGPSPVPGAPTTVTSPTTPTDLDLDLDLAAAQARVSFPIRMPRVAGATLRTIEVDERVPGGLVVLGFDGFTLVQVASAPGEMPTLRKVLDPGTQIENVTVAGTEGMWISGNPHQVGYISREGALELDTVRRAGDVLLWQDAGVTLRIEGLTDRNEALRIAETVA